MGCGESESRDGARACRVLIERRFLVEPAIAHLGEGRCNATGGGTVAPIMGEPALSAEEAQVLAAIVRGDRPDLRNRNLIRLSRLRLIMVQGATHFVPTALGYDWYRRLEQQLHGSGESGL